MKKNKEIFVDVVGYEGLYQISNMGRVKSLARVDALGRFVKEKILKAQTNNRGYFYVGLSKDGKMKNFMIHQLVAMALLNHIPDRYKRVVDHIDNDKNNNRLENLQITTARHNTSKDKKGCSSEYTGVSWFKPTSKWVSKIQIQGKLLHLGYFEFELDAAAIYDEMLKVVENRPNISYKEAKRLRYVVSLFTFGDTIVKK